MNIYQVFHDLPARKGNFVTVTGIDSLDPQIQAIRPNSAMAQCHVTKTDQYRYHIACQQRDQPIQCCGHGLLAVAHALFESGEELRIHLGGGVWAERDPGLHAEHQTWLHLPALPASIINLPSWAMQLLTDDNGNAIFPLAAAATDAPDGYLLLQLDEQVSIATIQVDLAAIIANSKRAVLLWQLDSGNPGRVRIRYFAPQYGNNEDAATGSVLRVLAPQLQHITDLACFEVIQCSSWGGRMTARNVNGSVAVSGNIRLIDSKDLPAPWQA